MQAPNFGRRMPVVGPFAAPANLSAARAVKTVDSQAGVQSDAIADLRSICLARLEPTAVAGTSHDPLHGPVDGRMNAMSVFPSPV